MNQIELITLVRIQAFKDMRDFIKENENYKIDSIAAYLVDKEIDDYRSIVGDLPADSAFIDDLIK